MIKNKDTLISKSIQCLALFILILFLGVNAWDTPVTLTAVFTDPIDISETPNVKNNSAPAFSETAAPLDSITYSEIERSIKKLQFISDPESKISEKQDSPSDVEEVITHPETQAESETQTEALSDDGINSRDSDTEVTEYSSELAVPYMESYYSTDNDLDTPAIRLSKIDGFVPNYLKIDRTNYTLVKPGWDEFEQNLTEELKSYEGSWSLYFKELSSGRTISINNKAMESASLIKLYIMGAVYQQIENKTLEKTEKIQKLLNDMITVSDNESSNELVRSLSSSGDHQEGMAVVNTFIRENGFENTQQVNGLADPSLWVSTGEINTTSTLDCGKLLEGIYYGNLVSHLASRNMETLLLNQEINYKIPRGLPTGTHCANKTGEVSDTENDSAIVYSPGGDYILCIMSTDLENTDIAVSHINSISTQIYNYLN